MTEEEVDSLEIWNHLTDTIREKEFVYTDLYRFGRGNKPFSWRGNIQETRGWLKNFNLKNIKSLTISGITWRFGKHDTKD